MDDSFFLFLILCMTGKWSEQLMGFLSKLDILVCWEGAGQGTAMAVEALCVILDLYANMNKKNKMMYCGAGPGHAEEKDWLCV